MKNCLTISRGKSRYSLGTQMIAKGLRLSEYYLGWCLFGRYDAAFPDFRSSEKTFQLLTQVSGRAGRHELPGEVVIQTYTPEHYSIELAGEQDYDTILSKRNDDQKNYQYPPFYYISVNYCIS